MGLHPAVLSSALEGAGTVTSALVPWNTCGVFISDTLGIGVAQYGIYAIFNWLMPVINALCAYVGTPKDLTTSPTRSRLPPSKETVCLSSEPCPARGRGF